MSIRNPNTTLQSTASTLDLQKNKLGVLTSIILTLPDFELTESNLQDIDFMVDALGDGNIFPIHNVFDIVKQDKEAVYNESQHDFSYQGYRGKNINQIKFNLRLDYHTLLRQFNNQKLRVIYCFNNNSFLTTKNGSNRRGFLLSNINVEDIELFATNLSPLRLEHDDKAEIDSMSHTIAGYLTTEIDRRILNIEVNATATIITLSVKYLGNTINNLSSNEITLTDELYGSLGYSIFNYNAGIYQLSGFNVSGNSRNASSGCINILSEIYMGNQRYLVQAVVTYNVYDTYESGVYETFESGNYELFNT